MKRKLTVVVAVTAAILVIGPAAVLAGGRGDNFDRPIVIASTPYSDTHKSDKSASIQEGEPLASCGPGQASNSIWYAFTPEVTDFYIADTVGSDFTASGTPTVADTVLVAYEHFAGGPFIEVGCDDDSGDAYGGLTNTSWLEVLLEAGNTYYFDAGTYRPSNYGKLVFNFAED
jgi:hypothetical protein